MAQAAYEVHNVSVEIVAPKRKEADEHFDGKMNYASAFMKVALLFRDTVDAYKMGDGGRVFRNLKFLILHFDRGKHIKYRLWLWRMMTYERALLSEYERYAYINNIAINMTGGVYESVFPMTTWWKLMFIGSNMPCEQWGPTSLIKHLGQQLNALMLWLNLQLT